MNKAECKSILEYDEFPNYDILYCDPPWEERMTKWFRTKMKKDVGDAPMFSFNDIIHHLGKLAYTHKPFYIEYDKNNYQKIIDIMVSHGHNFADITQFPLYSKSQQVIISFNTEIIPIKNMTTAKDSTIEMLKRHGNGLIVFDPFAGIGYTAKIINQSGNYYYGSELNPTRYRKLKMVIEQIEHIKK